MKLLSVLLLALVCAVSPLVVAEAASVGGDVVNGACPITGKPVDGALFVEHGDARIGVCCARCKGAVGAWSAAQKDAYLARVRGEAPRASEVGDVGEEAPAFAEPDLLVTCPITGEALGDAPVEVELRATPGGPARAVRVCCAGCKKKAHEDPAGTLARVDELVAEQQRAWYPLDNCVVIPGEPLEVDGDDVAPVEDIAPGEDVAPREDIALEVVVGGRLFRVCCAGCVRQVRQDPAKFAAELDEAAKAAQRESYPFDHCLVMKEHTFAAGDEVRELVVCGLLVRVCCETCEAAVRNDPRRYLAELVAARSGAAAPK